MTRVLAISPGDGRDLRPWLDQLDVDAVLLREPGLSVSGSAAHARALGLTVHVHTRCADRPPMDFLHIRAREARPQRPFGVSCHDEAELDAAFASGAAYALLSPVFRPTSKPGDKRVPLGSARFTAIADGRRVYALGGITEQTAFSTWGVATLGFFFDVPAAAAGERSRALRTTLAKLERETLEKNGPSL